MTRPEAINTLKKLYATFDAIHETTDFEDGREEMEALDLAIEALKKLDRGYIDKGLLMFLALSFPAPEEAPDDWFHHGDENLDAWRAYIMKCKERGYYDIPMIEEENDEQQTNGV